MTRWPLALIAVTGLGLPMAALAQRQGATPSPRRPAAETRVHSEGGTKTRARPSSTRRAGSGAADGGGAGEGGARVDSAEAALYLRERPSTASEQQIQDALIERLLRERERLVLRRRGEAIGLLEEFVRDEPATAAEMPDALLRLAELHWEQSRSDYLRNFALWQRTPAAQRSEQPPRPDMSRALALYARILINYRAFDRYDFVLYMNAFALVESEQMDAAVTLYQRIVDEFPRSRYVADAHFAIAESYFGAGTEHQRALDSYERVLQHPDSELYDIALFKSAWSLWRLNRSADAALRFRQVLDLGLRRRRLSTTQRQRLQRLQNEALASIIDVFTEDESNTADDVHRFLREIGGERYATQVLSSLAERFDAQTRHERAVQAYRLLLQLEPLHADAPNWQAAIAANLIALESAEAAAELDRLAAGTARDGRWARAQSDPEIVSNARNLAERSLRTEALRQHDMAQEHNEPRRFAQAVALYEVYLRHFPRSPRSYDIRYFAAEIYFHRMQRYEDAGRFYLAAVDQNRRGRYTRDALYNAISALEAVREAMLERCGRRRTEPDRPREVAPTPATPPTPTPPAAGAAATTPATPGTPAPAGAQPATGQPATQPDCPTQGEGGYQETENDRQFTRAIELYVELFPNDPDLPEILFRQGNLYYDRGIFDPAVRMFGQLLERFPQSRFAQRAGELILESFNRAQDFGNIERWARRLKQSPAFQNPDSQRRLDALIVQAVFKQGEQLAARGDHAEAAAAYLRAAEEFPRDQRAPQAMYNAGQEHQRAGDPEAAAEAYDDLLERFPSSNEAQLGVWSAAQMFESLAQLRDAARYYDTYGRRFPQGEHGADALYNAVLLRVTVGDDEAASDSGQAFIRQFPQHASLDDVYFLMGRAHEQGERWQQAADLYRQYIDRTRNNDRKIEALTRLGQVLLHMNNQRGARETLERAVALGRRHSAELHNEGRYHAAHARYLQGEMVLAEFGEVRIAGDIAGLRTSLQRKAEMLQRAATVYLDVVGFNVADWATAALFRIGQVYEQFADSIRNAPVPTELNEEEQNVYREELEGFVIPIEERALEAYEEGYRRAIQLRIYNRWTQRMREALTRLNDSLYPALREIGADMRTGEPRIVLRPLDGLRRDTAAIRGRGTEQAAEPGAAAREPTRARTRRERRSRDRGRPERSTGGDRSGRRGGR